MQGIRYDAGQYAKHRRAIRGVDLVLPHSEDVPEEINQLFITRRKSDYYDSLELAQKGDLSHLSAFIAEEIYKTEEIMGKYI